MIFLFYALLICNYIIPHFFYIKEPTMAYNAYLNNAIESTSFDTYFNRVIKPIAYKKIKANT